MKRSKKSLVKKSRKVIRSPRKVVCAKPKKTSIQRYTNAVVQKPYYNTYPVVKELHQQKSQSCEVYSDNDKSQFRDTTHDLLKYCRTITPSEIKYVAGPEYFSYLSWRGLKIYLFGERHDNVHICGENYLNTVNMAGLIESLVKYNSNVLYDFFYEEPFQYKKTRLSNFVNARSMEILNTTFKNCIISDLRDACRYKNLRIHYVDFRRFNSTFEEWTLFNKIFDNSMTKSEGLMLCNIIRNMLSNDRLMRQYRDNMDMYNYIKELINFEIDKYTRLGNVISLMDASSMVLDIYAIGRMFRNYNISRQNYPQDTAKNIIFYGGSWHTQNIESILTKFGAIIHTKVVNSGISSCINIDVEDVFKV